MDGSARNSGLRHGLVLSLTSLTAALGVTVCAISAQKSIQSLIRPVPIQGTLSSALWWTHVHLKTASAPESVRASISSPESAPTPKTSPDLVRADVTPKVRKPTKARLRARVDAVRTVASAPVLKAPSTGVQTRAVVSVMALSPAMVSTQSKVISQTTQSPAPQVSSKEDDQATPDDLLLIHSQLKRQFVAALEQETVAPTIQMAGQGQNAVVEQLFARSSDDDQLADIVEEVRLAAASAKLKREQTKKVARTKKARRALPVLAQAVVTQPQQDAVAEAKPESILTESSAPIPAPLEAQAAPAVAAIQVPSVLSPPVLAEPALPTENAPEAGPTLSIQAMSSQILRASPSQSAAPATVPFKAQSGESGSSNTQRRQTIPDKTPDTSQSRDLPPQDEVTHSSFMNTQEPQCKLSNQPLDSALAGVDGFDHSLSVNIQSEEVTLDGESLDSQGRWVKARASAYMSTLMWRSYRSCTKEPVFPILSQNSIVLAAKLQGVKVHASSGIVFGRVMDGYRVEFSGRAEAVVMVNEDKLPVTPLDTKGVRTFAFLNASPGAHLLYVVSRDGRSRAAVAAPTFESTATYIDATYIKSMRLSGSVADDHIEGSRPMRGVEVSVVGQSTTASARTDAGGRFVMKNVLQVSNNPLYIETDAPDEFTHRYRLAGSLDREITLYRLSAPTIARWLRRLEGTVSAESGIAVGALPSTVAAHDPGNIFARIRTAEVGAPFTPETYALSNQERLEGDQPLDPSPSRFVGIQIPEGVTLAHAESKTGKVVWSELFFSSRNVVSVLSVK